ncbi:hypothetical protein ACF9IK_07585 [Kitasatospora hibisci]|uniref:hypothetical protein n=1 Tax=Kitasatospora hibisci TaxID=3369522 RepID=UPI00375400F2
MSRRGSARVFLGRSLTVGCALVALAAGPALACPTGDEMRQAPASAGAQAAVPVAAARATSGSDLEVIRIDPEPAPPRGITTLHAFVANLGPDRTASPFTMVVTLPEGVEPEGPFFPDNCYPFQNGHRVRCTFPAGLAAGRSATGLIPLRVSEDTPVGSLLTGWVAVRSDDDTNEANNRQPFEVSVTEG